MITIGRQIPFGLQKKKEEKDKKLLEKYRRVFCLTDEDGEKYVFELEGNFSNWVRTKEVFPAEINDKFIQAFIRRLFEYEARQDSLMMDVLDL